MIINNGDYMLKGYGLTEGTVVNGGSFVLCKITNVGDYYVKGAFQGNLGGQHRLDYNKGIWRGVYLNGVKQDTYEYIVMSEPFDKAKDFMRDLDAVGEDGLAAFEWIVDHVKANPLIEWVQLSQVDYPAQSFWTYISKLLEVFQVHFPATGYAAARDYIVAQPKAKLLGLKYATGEVLT